MKALSVVCASVSFLLIFTLGCQQQPKVAEADMTPDQKAIAAIVTKTLANYSNDNYDAWKKHFHKDAQVMVLKTFMGVNQAVPVFIQDKKEFPHTLGAPDYVYINVDGDQAITQARYSLRWAKGVRKNTETYELGKVDGQWMITKSYTP